MVGRTTNGGLEFNFGNPVHHFPASSVGTKAQSAEVGAVVKAWRHHGVLGGKPTPILLEHSAHMELEVIVGSCELHAVLPCGLESQINGGTAGCVGSLFFLIFTHDFAGGVIGLEVVLDDLLHFFLTQLTALSAFRRNRLPWCRKDVWLHIKLLEFRGHSKAGLCHCGRGNGQKYNEARK